MVGVIICSQLQGETLRYKCRCCGWETDDIEWMAPGGMCWDCGLSIDGKEGCENCARSLADERFMEGE